MMMMKKMVMVTVMKVMVMSWAGACPVLLPGSYLGMMLIYSLKADDEYHDDDGKHDEIDDANKNKKDYCGKDMHDKHYDHY